MATVTGVIKAARYENGATLFTVDCSSQYFSGPIDVASDVTQNEAQIVASIADGLVTALQAQGVFAAERDRIRVLGNPVIAGGGGQTATTSPVSPMRLATVEVPAVAASAVKSRAVQWLVEVVAASAGAAGILKAFDAFF